jgi:hypothetical protein
VEGDEGRKRMMEGGEGGGGMKEEGCLVDEEEELGEAQSVKLADDSEHVEIARQCATSAG